MKGFNLKLGTFLLCILLIGAMASLSACGILDMITGNPETPTLPTSPTSGAHNEHEYSEEFCFDENYHWFVCLYEGCDSIDRKLEHNLENRVCTVCGYFQPRYVNAVNHRGYSRIAPENTLVAFRMSKEMGFSAVECDISFTMDGVPVLLHDDTINRTSNGTGSIASLTYEAIKDLDFGSWKSPDYAGEKIPTFDEFLALCQELELHAYIELKDNLTADEAQVLSDTLDKYTLEYSWISFHVGSLEALMAIRPNDRYGFLVSNYANTHIDRVCLWHEKGYDVFLDCNYGSVDDKAVEYAKEHGVAIEVWTIDSKSDIVNMNEYVSGFTSDYTNANEVLNNKDYFGS